VSAHAVRLLDVPPVPVRRPAPMEARVVDRWHETCSPVIFTGTSQRGHLCAAAATVIRYAEGQEVPQ
jgi:hypothetical protein